MPPLIHKDRVQKNCTLLEAQALFLRRSSPCQTLRRSQARQEKNLEILVSLFFYFVTDSVVY